MQIVIQLSFIQILTQAIFNQVLDKVSSMFCFVNV